MEYTNASSTVNLSFDDKTLNNNNNNDDDLDHNVVGQHHVSQP